MESPHYAPDRQDPAPWPRAMPRCPIRARWTIAAFCAVQVIFLLTIANGPTGDEGIYAWVGMEQVLQIPTNALADHINGSPLFWPRIAGPVWLGGGLTLLRLVAIALSVMAIAVAADACRRYSGARAGDWAALALATCGPLFAVAHLGVYDVPAMFCAAAAFWCVVRSASCVRTDGFGRHLQWIAGAAVMAALAYTAKYAYLLLALPIGAAAVAAAPRRFAAVATFAGIVAAIILTHNMAVLGRPWPISYAAYAAATPLVPLAAIAGEQAILGVPLFLAWLGWREMRRSAAAGRPLLIGSLLALGLLLWPAFHLAEGTAQAAHKHVAGATVVAAPLVAAGLASLSTRRGLFALVLAFNAALAVAIENSWSDARPAIAQLIATARPGDRIRSLAGTYRFLPALRVAGLDRDFAETSIATLDTTATWILHESFGDANDNAAAVRIERSGFAVAQSHRSTFVGGDEQRPFSLHRVTLTVYRRLGAQP